MAARRANIIGPPAANDIGRARAAHWRRHLHPAWRVHVRPPAWRRRHPTLLASARGTRTWRPPGCRRR